MKEIIDVIDKYRELKPNIIFGVENKHRGRIECGLHGDAAVGHYMAAKIQAEAMMITPFFEVSKETLQKRVK